MATTPQSYFMGNDGFVWFVGVVEDRNDPSRLGRLRVRCLGFHTESLTELPTADLPWAYVMHPVTDAAMQGMGTTPAFIAEGAWVIGFFRDSQMKQQPIIIGSLPGIPQSPANPFKGFNDPHSPKSPQEPYAGEPPYGPYPVDGDEYTVPSGHGLEETDTNRLAQGPTSETHNKLKERRATRLRGDPELPDIVNPENTGVPIATKPFLKEVSQVAIKEARKWWDEPHPKGHKEDADPYPTGQYPYNHVFESEAGHITEIDDSPGGSRLFRQHSAGTFEEIHPDGTKVVKVVGDNYEIIAGKTNIFMQGDVNITVKGNVRELIKGDYVLEVEGDYWNKIHVNKRIKIGAGKNKGNKEEEIGGSFSYEIDDESKGLVHGFWDLVVNGHVSWVVEGVSKKHKSGFALITSKRISAFCQEEDIQFTAKENFLVTASADLTLQSKGKMFVRAKDDMTIHTEGDMVFVVYGDHNSSTLGEWTDTAVKERFIKGSKVRINDPAHGSPADPP